MAAVTAAETHASASALSERSAPASPAGPVEDGSAIRMPPKPPLTRTIQSLRFVADPFRATLLAYRDFGDVYQFGLMSRREPFVATAHPDHVKSLFKARGDDAPSLTGESPLRPILGPNSVLTLTGPRHMRQRKLLLPPFHGEAITHYVAMIEAAAERELASWPVGEPFALAPRMSAVTLEVIMGGIFGISTDPPKGSIERRLRDTIRTALVASTHPLYGLVEVRNARAREPRGVLKAVMAIVDRHLYAVIRARRAGGARGGNDVLSLLLQARDEEGRPLTDEELRDELLTLVLAGHETTANSLAWTFERLLRHPKPYEKLRSLVRSDSPDASPYLEATVHEGMRVRPVIPMIVRKANRPWRLGEYVVPRGTPIAVNIVAIHHREDVYPDAHVFDPDRFVGVKPGTYTWIPFGGGIRRCLGASLALAEQRVVIEAVARRVDLRAEHGAPERARQRNVTMIPRHGGRVVVTHKLPA